MSDGGFSPEPVPLPDSDEPFWDYGDVGLVILLTVPLLLLVFALLGSAFYIIPIHVPRTVQLLSGQFLFYGLWFFFLFGWLKMRYQRPVWRALGWIRPPQGYPRSALWGLLTAAAVILATAVLRPPESGFPLMELLKDKLSIVLIGIFAVTLGPLCEELAFRGFLMPLLIRRLGVAAGIILTALLFASLHGQEYGWSWRHLLLIGIAGGAFGWLRYRSGSTSAAAVMHAAYNLVFFLGLLAQRKELLR